MDDANAPGSDPVPPPGATGIAPGRVIGGRYRLERAIASGGMASVWEAVDEVLARKVAVKVLHPHLAIDAQFPARFRREAVAAARLAHPNIVSIYDTCSEVDAAGTTTDAIVMELVRGTTLRDELDRSGTLAPATAADVVAQVCDALGAAHAAGIVHRDIKPANVLLSTDGRVLVTDFGIAKASDGLDLTSADSTVGTAKYLAPEQVAGGAVDARADVYAAGVVLYESLAGRPPFVADTEAGTALARLHQDPRPVRELRADVPGWLEEVTLAALARDPDQRVPSAGALRDALRGGRLRERAELGGLDTQAVSAVPATAAAPPPPLPVGPDPTIVTPSAVPAPALAPYPAPGHPPPYQHAHAAPPAAPPRRRRRWGAWIFGTLVVAAVAVVAVLLTQTRLGGGGDNEDRDPLEPGSELVVAGARSLDPDPPGDGQENDDAVANIVDGDATTTWPTSCYSSTAFGNLKPGVGFVLELDEAAALDALAVETVAGGWSAEVYVADEAISASPEDTSSGWGEPVATVEGADATATFDLAGAEGGAVLVWFTALPGEPRADCDQFPFGIAVADATVG